MSTTTAEPEVNADELRSEADEAQKAADQLAARIRDLMPDWEGDGETVMDWTPESREDVAKLLNDPPERLGDWGDEVSPPLTFEEACTLYVAVIQRKLHNLENRERTVKQAERRLTKEKELLADIDREIEDLKKQRKGQESKVEAAVFALQSRVRDQVTGQNALPLVVDEDESERGSNDPADTAPIADLDLTPSLTEKLVEGGIARISDAIAWASEDKRRKIAGIGDAAFETISEALNVWRDNNPVEGD